MIFNVAPLIVVSSLSGPMCKIHFTSSQGIINGFSFGRACNMALNNCVVSPLNGVIFSSFPVNSTLYSAAVENDNFILSTFIGSMK
eukprot:UN19171